MNELRYCPRCKQDAATTAYSRCVLCGEHVDAGRAVARRTGPEEAALVAARADILWGRPVEPIRDRLLLAGLSDRTVEGFLADTLAERRAGFRRRGARRAVLGALAVGIAGLFVASGFHARTPRRGNPFGVAILLGVGGLGALVSGLFLLTTGEGGGSLVED